jgi:uncharacterized membrane protein YecN with MAPEG domain
MNDIHTVEMPQTFRYLKQSILVVKQRNQVRMLFGRQDHFGKRSLAKVESDVKELIAAFLAVVSNDISVVITFLKKLDLLLR